VATKLPTVNIPVAVDSRGVDAGVRHIEHKMAGLRRKLARMQPTASIGPKANQATAFMGSVGRLGPAAGMLAPMGGAGAAVAAPLALAGFARANVEAMAAMTKGATDAFEQMQRTGEQTFAINSEVLRLLAANERSAAAAGKVPGFMDAFRQGGMTSVDQGGAGILERISTATSQLSAFFGAYMSGQGFKEASTRAALVTTSDERIAAILGQQLKTLEQERMSGTNQSPVDMLLGSLNYRIEQLAIAIGRYGL
jgi:hypothetical protein